MYTSALHSHTNPRMQLFLMRLLTDDYLEQVFLSPIDDTVDFKKVQDIEEIHKILGLKGMDELEDGGHYLFDHFHLPENSKESAVEKKLMSIIEQRPEVQVDAKTRIKVKACSQVFTHDHGKLDVLLFEKLVVQNSDETDSSHSLHVP